MIYNNAESMVGDTPLLKINCEELKNATVYVKMESCNPTGSIKDRACLSNIHDAINSEKLRPGKTILDASSGNMACALAYFGSMMGYPVKVICNTKLTADKRDFIEYFGAELEVFGDLTIQGNRMCNELAQTEEGKEKYCFLDQLHNPANPLASYNTLGPEILKEIPDVAAIVGSMGSGGSMCGLSRYIKEQNPNIKIFTSEADTGTKIPGTGSFVDGEYVTPFITELRTRVDDSFLVNQSQAENRTEQLAKQGVFAGFQAGGVLEALIRGVQKHNIEGNVVMVIGDAGWKNMEKLKQLIKK